MKKILILILSSLLFMVLNADDLNTNDKIDESMVKQSRFSGTSLTSREDKIKYGSPFEAKLLVEDAINFMKENDLEMAFEELTNKDSRFFNKDLYIFVFDMEGNMLTHGAEKSLIGKNLIDLKDSAGKYFVQDFIDLMQKSESGWIEYYWRNYENQKVEIKLTYLKKFDKNIFVGCGAYQPRY